MKVVDIFSITHGCHVNKQDGITTVITANGSPDYMLFFLTLSIYYLAGVRGPLSKNNDSSKQWLLFQSATVALNIRPTIVVIITNM